MMSTFDLMMTISAVLDQRAYVEFIVIAHWNSPQVEISLHSDLHWLRDNQYLFLHVKDAG